jgi:hypothetical protein
MQTRSTSTNKLWEQPQQQHAATQFPHWYVNPRNSPTSPQRKDHVAHTGCALLHRHSIITSDITEISLARELSKSIIHIPNHPPNP